MALPKVRTRYIFWFTSILYFFFLVMVGVDALLRDHPRADSFALFSFMAFLPLVAVSLLSLHEPVTRLADAIDVGIKTAEGKDELSVTKELNEYCKQEDVTKCPVLVNGWKESVSLDEAVALLNAMLVLDPVATSALVEQRIPCNTALVGHPSVQISPGANGKDAVGLLGVLNGLFGCYNGRGAIVAHYEDHDLTTVVMFTITSDFVSTRSSPLATVDPRLMPGYS